MQPNILLITTDQQRFDAAGGRGPSFLRTPHFDDLRRGGITYHNAYTDCPICVPSRVSLMTGKSVFAHGMSHNGNTNEAMDEEGTLPTLLRDVGYQTAAIGKMHFWPQRKRHGFEEMLLPDDYYREMNRRGSSLQPMRHGLGQNELYPGMATLPECETLTSWTAEKCLEYIKVRRDPSKPFFLWCSFAKPHPPFDPPEPYYSMYRDCVIPTPAVGEWRDSENCPQVFKRIQARNSFDLLNDEVLKEARSAYYGLITQCDYNLGRVLAALQDEDIYKDTLIIYTSDHGEYLGDHRAGAKTFFHEASAHVPMVLRLPPAMGERLHGQEVDDPVILADVLPTLMNYVGRKAPSGTDGQDMLAPLKAKSTKRSRRIFATASPLNPHDYVAMREDNWKYLWYPEGESCQLFDLSSDPLETRDLSRDKEYNKVRKSLHKNLFSDKRIKQLKLKPRKLKRFNARDLRASSRLGYHSDTFPVDVRH